MNKWQGGMMLDRKKSVWDAKEHPLCNPAKLADEESLFFETANMLEDRV
jgi:hypothetical protein